MARDEFSARNGTLSVNLQTRIQRNKISDRFEGKGVSSGNAKHLFGGVDGSPIGYDNNDNDNGLSNRGDSLGDVYTRYAELAIDPDGEVNGFGFEGTNTANMNYSGSLDLFDRNSGELKIADGQAYEDGTKAYRGFPDLKVGDIHNPTLNQQQSSDNPDRTLEQSPDGSSYGHETKAFRDEVNIESTLLGRHLDASGDGNGNADTLGKYFTKNYVEIEAQ